MIRKRNKKNFMNNRDRDYKIRFIKYKIRFNSYNKIARTIVKFNNKQRNILFKVLNQVNLILILYKKFK